MSALAWALVVGNGVALGVLRWLWDRPERQAAARARAAWSGEHEGNEPFTPTRAERARARDWAAWSGEGHAHPDLPTLREQARARRAFTDGGLPGRPRTAWHDDHRGHAST